uniref:Protein THYLAKOID FORMATION1, chloroplastic n=1 Tax=Cannabis sativa TaxID=3483 RepID=A0A803QK60_CANSA
MEYKVAQTQIISPPNSTQQDVIFENLGPSSLQPSPGMYKVSVDAAARNQTNIHGYGAIDQDSQDRIIDGFYSSASLGLPPIFAEAEQRNRSALSGLIMEIVFSLSSFPSATIRFAPKTNNTLTHNLAQAAFGTGEELAFLMPFLFSEGELTGMVLAPYSPTVADTKLNFLKSYKRPIPSVYNSVLQELLVQQHLIKYKKSYSYDPIFALGFVTVYDQLMDGYPSDEDREAIFQAYIKALNEDPEKYRADSQKLEEWARAQNSSSLVEFSSKEGEVEEILKDISERAANGNFSYSRFFAVGLFRLLELSNATEPTILEKLCTALNINKRSVDRDLDVYRNLLSKLVQAKELLKEYVAREKKKREERTGSTANEAITKCLGDYQYARQ